MKKTRKTAAEYNRESRARARCNGLVKLHPHITEDQRTDFKAVLAGEAEVVYNKTKGER